VSLLSVGPVATVRLALVASEYQERILRAQRDWSQNVLLLRGAAHPDTETAAAAIGRYAAHGGETLEAGLLLPIAFQRFGMSKMPGEVASRAAMFFAATWAETRLVLDATLPSVLALEAEGVPALLLKGAALSSSRILGEGFGRPMVDVDVLVPKRDFRRAFSFLLAEGWAPSNPNFSAQLEGHHSINLRLGMHGSLDLHSEPLQRSHNLDEDESMWTRAVSSTIGRNSYLVPCLEDLIVLAVGHAWIGEARPIADVQLLMTRAGLALDVEQVVSSIKRRAFVLHAVRFFESHNQAVPGFVNPILERLEAVRVTRNERVLHSLERSDRMPKGVAPWVRQIAYGLQRTQGEPVINRVRQLRSFFLFDSGASGALDFLAAAFRAARKGER
jgi:hypothetical protein